MKTHMRMLRRNERRVQARVAHGIFLDEANKRPNAPSVRRVLELVKILRDAENRRLEWWQRAKVRGAGLAGATGAPFNRELQNLEDGLGQLIEKADGALLRYKWTPTIYRDEFRSLAHAFHWNDKRASESFSENEAVAWLLRQVSGSGMVPAPILRFRQCRRCSRWFYALTNHQTYCSTKCRQKDHADNPVFRAKRATYMRETWRPQEREFNQKALEGASDAKTKKA